jgi:addiction module HigA family antidote
MGMMPKDGWVFSAPTTHPGEMLREEFLIPMGISANQLALRTRMPATRISEIVRERRGISAETALRLGRFFGMPAAYWLNLQALYDLSKAQSEIGAVVEKDVEPLRAGEAAA